MTGLLSLLLYVGHEFAVPGKAILEALGLPGAAALLLPVGLFFLVWAIAGRRLYKLYYG